MFGRPMMDHATRYDYAEEWLEIVRRLWTSRDEWDFEGKYFRIERGFLEPKPLQPGGRGTSPRAYFAVFTATAFSSAKRLSNGRDC